MNGDAEMLQAMEHLRIAASLLRRANFDRRAFYPESARPSPAPIPTPIPVPTNPSPNLGAPGLEVGDPRGRPARHAAQGSSLPGVRTRRRRHQRSAWWATAVFTRRSNPSFVKETALIGLAALTVLSWLFPCTAKHSADCRIGAP
jgi:hypothetical protein